MAIPDLNSIFIRYEDLSHYSDAIFAKVASQYPECVKCHQGCSDCCSAVFDLSLVEAMHINLKFAKAFPFGSQRSELLAKAAKFDRDIAILKRGYFHSVKERAEGATTEEEARSIAESVMEQAARDRVPCPLLGDDGSCLMYEFRPITCRIYGIPLNIEGKSRVCPISGFSSGIEYPAVQISKIQDMLDALSLEIQQTCSSRFKDLHKVYIPISMALLTKYDEKYLGIGEIRAERD